MDGHEAKTLNFQKLDLKKKVNNNGNLAGIFQVPLSTCTPQFIVFQTVLNVQETSEIQNVCHRIWRFRYVLHRLRNCFTDANKSNPYKSNR